jgi:hypothetical protein
MNNKTQTSIEWLIDQVFGEHTHMWEKEIAQARLMNSSEKYDAYTEGYTDGYERALQLLNHLKELKK